MAGGTVEGPPVGHFQFLQAIAGPRIGQPCGIAPGCCLKIDFIHGPRQSILSVAIDLEGVPTRLLADEP